MSSANLIHLIYASSAAPGLAAIDLLTIMQTARRNNARQSVTGLLLYSSGNIFQVLEGDEETAVKLFAVIKADSRHRNVTKIIQEPIVQRVFGDWSMGFAEVDTSELAGIEGLNDFFQSGLSLAHLQPGRAQKLLAAFGQGRWRARLQEEPAVNGMSIPTSRLANAGASGFSFAFQPIIDLPARAVYSYEALVRGLNDEPAYVVINRCSSDQTQTFDSACRVKAIEVAARLGMRTHLNLNLIPSAAVNVAASLNTTIEAANRHRFPLERIVVEATEVQAIVDHARFVQVVNEYRRVGMKFAIDDFGAGYSGLSLLSEFQPDIVKLDMGLVRGIQAHGPRQAIVRAIAQVCVDLGIDFVVEGVETLDELNWFNDLGVQLYQGYLFARPKFEAMPPFHIPYQLLDPASLLKQKVEESSLTQWAGSLPGDRRRLSAGPKLTHPAQGE